MEFAEKVFSITVQEACSTPAWREYSAANSVEEGQLMFTSRVLTWLQHSHYIRDFHAFCARRELNIFECTPYIINLYSLHLAQRGKTFGSVEAFLSALAFFFKFYYVRDFVQDPMINTMKKFLAKVCAHGNNRKEAFGSTQVRLLWNQIDQNGGIHNIPLLELRTFVMTIFQHVTFCRFSDLSNLRLKDVLHEVDYFTVHIRYSKTDQAGVGQTVFIPKLDSVHQDPHMLMCLYLHKLDEKSIQGPGEMYLFPPLK